MDITSKYRTKYPPKEHENAVRMLLENIAARQEAQDDSVKIAKNSSYSYDRRSLNSNDSESLSDQVVMRSNSKLFNGLTKSSNDIMHHHRTNKATSTSDSVSTTTSSSIDQENTLKEPIPSRTIAVQCDLKSSSLKRDHLFDTSMQASSISSTRYGFYNFSPETLAQRRKLERSISNRDINRSTLNRSRQLADNQLGSQIEAPTSMSELSSSLSVSDYELNRSKNREYNKYSKSLTSNERKNVHNNNNNDHNLTKFEQVEGHHYGRENVNKGSIFGSMVDNSTVNTRVNSLPRRPVTALSYVSTTKLRGQQQSVASDCSSDQESDLQPREKPIRNRAMSQQTLVNRPRTPAPGSSFNETSSSHSDLGADLSSSGANRRSSLDQQSINFQGDRSTDEMLITKRVPETIAPTKPPRPTLISSAHTEQMRDYRTLDMSGTKGLRPPTNVDYNEVCERLKTNAVGNQWQEDNSEDENKSLPTYRNRPVYQAGTGLVRKASRILHGVEGVYDENLNSCGEQAQTFWKKPIVSSRQPNDVEGQYFAPEQDEFKSRYNGKLNNINNRPHNSMSLTRGRSQVPSMQLPTTTATTEGYLDNNARKPTNLTLNDRAYSQTLLADSQNYMPSSERGRNEFGPNSSNEAVCRSISMRQIARPSGRYSDANQYPINHLQNVNQNGYQERANFEQRRTRELVGAKTYTDSSSKPPELQRIDNSISGLKSRRCSRSRSMRNVNDSSANNDSTSVQREFYSPQTTTTTNNNSNNFQQYHSGSESSVLETVKHRFTRAQPLDYDSQHRLNESGLPEINSMTMQARKISAPSSYLGVAGNNNMHPSYTVGRSAQIRGRAMSQQSLSRSNVPLMAGRRRRGPRDVGSNSGSDVGGSSMSLVSRLNGRYENAHTRNPVVMYIPQVTQSNLAANKFSSTLRKSSRTRLKSSSQDLKSKRSLSRNGSDSESSSMLRTLLRPKSRNQSNGSSKRRMNNPMLERHHHYDDEEEDLDRIGHLATELDSYKFRRRYSVPKDAKINWFAKLKQKVSSSGR